MRIKERGKNNKKKRKLFHTIEFKEIIDYFGRGGEDFSSPVFAQFFLLASLIVQHHFICQTLS